ncbi:hypothetical protein O7632_03590 [Solwaraspora sp. WMMD406]|uniref:hypothetical protein n=1 Tax=Solwaraspora sp. WMMD406 TaxID=3016095 RepID=UPI002415B91D|nr:hypothetical protein [Solwaraspora sp. WMMD406]MDG4763195.1 hypothetical protein [Solwaraspora sp. WMMD406]
MLTRVGAAGRRFAGLVAAATLAATALTVVGLATGGPAAAQSSGGDCTPSQPGCDAWVEDPGNPGGPGNDGGGGPGNGGGNGGASSCYHNGELVPCYDEILGWFNRDDGCYYRVAEPQPPATPESEGRTAYTATCNAGQASSITVWRDDPPPGFDDPPDPDELRRRAYARINFTKPVIRTAPSPGTTGLVGLPIWLWSQRSETAWGPQDESESDRGLTVRVVGKVTEVRFDMGNGDTVTCERGDAFTPYDRTVHGASLPDCGYRPGYDAPGTYEITATTYWEVHWELNGEFQEVFDTQTLTSTATVEIEELQVVRE